MASFTVDANVWIASYVPRDRFHFASVAFLKSIFGFGHTSVGPELLLIEVAGALARRHSDPEAGLNGLRRLTGNPSLRLDPLTGPRLVRAAALGAQLRLRGTGAIYAATADALSAPLISWDADLCARAGGRTPAQFLDENATFGGRR